MEEDYIEYTMYLCIAMSETDNIRSRKFEFIVYKVEEEEEEMEE